MLICVRRGRTLRTSRAESFFSRLRRMVSGQHHRVSARYLHQYACEAAWKEDNRRLPSGVAFSQTVGLQWGSPTSRQWKGYREAFLTEESSPIALRALASFEIFSAE